MPCRAVEPWPAAAGGKPPQRTGGTAGVEQGLLDAKSESTFKPEGWTPKLKVIEVWNKAFPKQ